MEKRSFHEGGATDKILDITFTRSPGNFYQVNTFQNKTIINLVVELFSSMQGKTILDLYCGCGNFSLFLARSGFKVTGADTNRSTIMEAVSNARDNMIDTCRFITADTGRLPENILNKEFDGILLNPPRTGCSRETIETIITINPHVILYISCNPSTLARDLRKLIDEGYEIDTIQPVDMFPQTYHIETVVKLFRI